MHGAHTKKNLWMSTYKFQNVRARKLARHKNSVPREEIDDEPVEKTESKWSEIGLQKSYWVSVDIKNSSSAGDALSILILSCNREIRYQVRVLLQFTGAIIKYHIRFSTAQQLNSCPIVSIFVERTRINVWAYGFCKLIHIYKTESQRGHKRNTQC